MSSFYERYSRGLLIACLLAMPFLVWEGESLPVNNDLETWLPKNSVVRARYESFKGLFGAEEVILVGLHRDSVDDQLVESIAGRIEALPGIRMCWTPQRMREEMEDLGVSAEEADQRISGLAQSEDKAFLGIVALLSETGVNSRMNTVSEVEDVLSYCQLSEDDVLFSGAPVVAAELDRLGSIDQIRILFIIAQGICFFLLLYVLRDWRLSAAILLITGIAIELTQCAVKWSGGEMNFILSALPVMVMVFTMAVSVHFVHYYRNCVISVETNPLRSALRRAWKPCGLAMLTTTIGLLSLYVSDIGPVRQFGAAAALGSLMAFVCGLGITPALLVVWPDCIAHESSNENDWRPRLAHRIVIDSRRIVTTSLAFVFMCAVGLYWMRAHIDPLDFLPRNSEVITDLRTIESKLTTMDSIEAVVDFGTEDASFVEKLQRVRELESRIGKHPSVRHTMSVASYFPTELPTRSLDLAAVLSKAQSNKNSTDFLSVDQRFWRISARVSSATLEDTQHAFADLEAELDGEPVTLTGISPLLEQAQHDIFSGFWESFATAFLVITVVMVFSLKSIKLALLAMVPNLAPIGVVFGILGWTGTPVDIGMMMTASIALGIAVDGTFHYLVTYQKLDRKYDSNDRAAWMALMQTGAPIAEAALIAAIGMLALTQSNFAPTIRFGWMMAVLLVSAVAADLILLPALIAWKRKPSSEKESTPITIPFTQKTSEAA